MKRKNRKPKVTLKKIRAGLYELVGIVCGGDKIYGPCGGTLHTESHKADGESLSSDAEFKWETFCTKCQTCDCNGHPNLKAVLANAAGYFAPSASPTLTPGGEEQ